jgi:hypothetical protein
MSRGQRFSDRYLGTVAYHPTTAGGLRWRAAEAMVSAAAAPPTHPAAAAAAAPTPAPAWSGAPDTPLSDAWDEEEEEEAAAAAAYGDSGLG